MDNADTTNEHARALYSAPRGVTAHSRRELKDCARQLDDEYALADGHRGKIPPYMNKWVTKYEYARLMCARVGDLSRNSTPVVPNYHPSEPGGLLKIAEAEFRLGILPFSLARRLPGGGEVVHSVETLHRLPACTYPSEDTVEKIITSQ